VSNCVSINFDENTNFVIAIKTFGIMDFGITNLIITNFVKIKFTIMFHQVNKILNKVYKNVHKVHDDFHENHNEFFPKLKIIELLRCNLQFINQ